MVDSVLVNINQFRTHPVERNNTSVQGHDWPEAPINSSRAVVKPGTPHTKDLMANDLVGRNHPHEVKPPSR